MKMITPETNAKKIETLSKIAKLLGDQIREQNERINMLSKEIEEFKSQIRQLSQFEFQSNSQSEIEMITDTPSEPTHKSEIVEKINSTLQTNSSSNTKETTIVNEKPVIVLKDEDPDKKDLLKALKVIDNL